MNRPLIRIDPKMQPEFYKTYQIVSPISTHFRNASCREVECSYYLQGWKTTVDISTELGMKQAYYIRMHSGRSFTVHQNPDTMLVSFLFPAGQNCFTVHKVPLERPELFVVKEGDWRGNPRRIDPIKRNPADWIDDFANHQDKLNDKFQQG